MPMKNFQFKSINDFLLKGNNSEIVDFYNHINIETSKILHKKDSVYIQFCDFDGKKNTHIKITNHPIENSHKIDIFTK